MTAAKGESPRLSMGATFGMSMRNKIGYSTKPQVVEFEEGKRIAWRNKGGPTWRYQLEPVDGGTRVVETYDLSTMRGGSILKRTRLPARTRDNMVRTLERLEQLLTTGAAGA